METINKWSGYAGLRCSSSRPRLVLGASLAVFICGILSPRVAQATEFWEVRARSGLVAGPERFQLDYGVGGGFDSYVTDDVGVIFGLDFGLISDLDESASPRALYIAPEVAVWFGEDAAPKRWLIQLRPQFGLLGLDGKRNILERVELGPAYGLQSENGSLRFRVGAMWAPGFTRPGAEASRFDPLGFGLRVTFGWAPPAEYLEVPDECLPCEPGCTCDDEE